VQCYQKGRLDFSGNTQNSHQTATTPQKPRVSAKEQQLQQLKDTYQEAYADHQHIKRNIDMLRHTKQQSVEEYLQEQGIEMQRLWHTVQQTLIEAQVQLEAVMNE